MITEAFRKLFKKLYDENSQGGGEQKKDIMRLYSSNEGQMGPYGCYTLYKDKDRTQLFCADDILDFDGDIIIFGSTSFTPNNDHVSNSYIVSSTYVGSSHSAINVYGWASGQGAKGWEYYMPAGGISGSWMSL